MEHNDTDVWGGGPDHVDIRMHEALYQTEIQHRFPECSLQVKDVEAFVREWEKTMQPKVGATWFEEYVSDVWLHNGLGPGEELVEFSLSV